MGVNQRKYNPSNKLKVSENKDIISSLPDELLGRILSFLPTKYSVATSVLSTRWRNVYKLSSNLDFDDSIIFNTRDQDKGNRRKNLFRKFVSRVLEQTNMSQIDKVRLKCVSNTCNSLIKSWVHAICLHKLTEFELSTDRRVHCELSLSQSFCQNLVVFKMDCSFRLHIPTIMAFPNLRVLHLKDITFEGYSKSSAYTFFDKDEVAGFADHELNVILSKCSLLEELVIVHCELRLSKLRVQCELQLSQWTCQNLLKLKLDSRFILSIPNSVTFPNLKVLFFKDITFVGMHSTLVHHDLNGILFRCPLLEELAIIGCDWGGRDMWFTNSLLRSLTLEDGLSEPLDQLNDSMVHFDLPSLVWFNYRVGLANQYVIRNLDSVAHAQLEIGFNDDDFDDEQQLCDTILDLIEGICSCRSLNLSRQCLEALTSGNFELPIFSKLTQLELTLGIDFDWSDVLLDFLNCSPCLESLTLVQGGKRPSQRSGQFLLEAQDVPSCVHSHLKSINIKNFKGFKGEKKMVKYFLTNANLLEEMVIEWDQRYKETDFLAKEHEILHLPKSSLSCSISFK
ncbi:unnamed protein product [Amaranthus hypochondriacus]